jgi:hypothetical protein
VVARGPASRAGQEIEQCPAGRGCRLPDVAEASASRGVRVVTKIELTIVKNPALNLWSLDHRTAVRAGWRVS